MVLHTLQGYKFHNKDPSGVRISFATPTNQIKTGYGGKGRGRRDSVGEPGFPKKQSHSQGFRQYSGKYSKDMHKRHVDRRGFQDEGFGGKYGQYNKKQYRGFDRRSKKERR